MSQRIPQRRALNLPRRLVAWAVLCSHSILATGLPIPAFAAEVNDGTPFPCRDHRCGCASAMQCWKQCCCFTNAQKVAWADEHGVKLPDFVVAAAKVEQAVTLQQSPVTESAGSCCRARRSCCSAQHSDASERTPQPASTCDLPTRCETSASECDSTDVDAVAWISTLSAQRCRGQAPECLGVAVSLPPGSPVRLISTVDLVRPFFFPSTAYWTSTSFSPPVPPPRAA